MTETENLTFRAFAPEDFERVAVLLGRTWLPEFDEAPQRAASQIELAHYLAQTTWSLLAERGEAELERDYLAGGSLGADAAVKLLIVSPDAKGLGLGGKLFSAALEHLREAGAAGYHLLTDDSCDFGFYEHKGLTQAMRRRSRAYWPGVDPEKDEFYVYVYEQEL